MKVLDKRDADKILNDKQIKEYMKQGFLCIMQTYDTFGYKSESYIRVKPSIRQELLDLHSVFRYYLENRLQEVMKIEELVSWLQR
jgi:threonyl-tRNA synthetase